MTELSASDCSSHADELPYAVRKPSRAELERAGRRFYDVLLLAEHLPTRHARTLPFPPLTRFLSPGD